MSEQGKMKEQPDHICEAFRRQDAVLSGLLVHGRAAGLGTGGQMRRAAKIDNSQPGIVAALRQAGFKVLVVNGDIDLIVYGSTPRGVCRLWLMDCKTALSKNGRVEKTKTQHELDLNGWPILYPTTPVEALAMLGMADSGVVTR